MNRNYYIRVLYETFDERYAYPQYCRLNHDMETAAVRWTVISQMIEYISKNEGVSVMEALISFYRMMLDGKHQAKTKGDNSIFLIGLDITLDAIEIIQSML